MLDPADGNPTGEAESPRPARSAWERWGIWLTINTTVPMLALLAIALKIWQLSKIKGGDMATVSIIAEFLFFTLFIATLATLIAFGLNLWVNLRTRAQDGSIIGCILRAIGSTCVSMIIGVGVVIGLFGLVL